MGKYFCPIIDSPYTVCVMHASHGVSGPIAYRYFGSSKRARAHKHTHSLWSQTSRFSHEEVIGTATGHRKTPLLRCNGYVLTRGSHWAGPCWNALTPAPRHAAPRRLTCHSNYTRTNLCLSQRFPSQNDILAKPRLITQCHS